MPGVTVTITQVETGRSRDYVTDGNDEYTAPSIPTGTYTIKAELAGFKSVTLSDIRLSVDQRARTDVKLEVGAMTESVEIVASTPLVQSSSSDLSTTVQEEQIKALPLIGRTFVSLTRTVPGVMRGIPGSNIDGAGSLAWRGCRRWSSSRAPTPSTSSSCRPAPTRPSSASRSAGSSKRTSFSQLLPKVCVSLRARSRGRADTGRPAKVLR